MTKIHVVLAVTLLTLSAGAFAQDVDSDAARRQRMDEAYADSHRTPGEAVREDTHRVGHDIHNGARDTGHAIHNGVRATGHAIHRGARATGHAIHHGVDKVTGH